MPRYIDADAFESSACERYCTDCDNSNGVKCRACWVDDMLGEVEDAPTVSPDEVRDAVCGVGKWILVDGIDEQAMARVHYIYCSKCGRQGLDTRRGKDCYSHYCPHCGARLTGGEND